MRNKRFVYNIIYACVKSFALTTTCSDCYCACGSFCFVHPIPKDKGQKTRKDIAGYAAPDELEHGARDTRSLWRRVVVGVFPSTTPVIVDYVYTYLILSYSGLRARALPSHKFDLNPTKTVKFINRISLN